MKITSKEVDHVAKLARIRFETDEADAFKDDMQNIIAYFDKLNELDTDPAETTSGGFDIDNVFRQDNVDISTDRENIIMNAPTHDDTFIIVPNVTE